MRKWSEPRRIAGNRLCSESDCGMYAITRPENKNNEYTLQRLSGSVWQNLGTFRSTKEIVKVIEDWGR